MNILSRLFGRKRKPAGPEASKGMVCCNCQAHIHKHELYTVLSVRHKNCRDPRGVGQLVIAESCEKPELLP